jgi:TPR repeat protein
VGGGRGEEGHALLREAAAPRDDDTPDAYLGPLPEPDDAAAVRLGAVGLMLLFAQTSAPFGLHSAAARWARVAAQSGEPEAMGRFGALLNRLGRPGTAESWLAPAARAGVPDAMNDYAVLLHGSGRGAEAEEWLRRAAEAGLPDAIRNYGVLLDGTGRAREARKWLRRADRAH